ncbi:DISARM system helicase DrmA [Lyngbya confervoides]|uniref:DISARM system helicase DrmA n=1 Tax=Lyngbya confervoides BDU141951 TaxID=1574623 RepID=A0ABD4T5Y9_9CYAN|nr:DISARM system helicase DrmA [Lyngbya confervoides]MCM1983977.1 DISARM system helicase DrmA [Lyngbya confervoides BDU141951]
MNIIKLPSKFPGELNLSVINQQLKNHEAQLDWSDVIEVENAALVSLLDGLDLSDHIDALGIETGMPAAIQADIAYFLEHEVIPTPSLPKQKVNPKPANIPVIWEPSRLFETEWVANASAHPDQALFLEQQAVIPNQISTKDRKTPNSQPFAESNLEPETPLPILRNLSGYGIRQEFEKRVIKDLLGPAEGEYEEINETRVNSRYLVGMLAPQRRATDSVDLDEIPELQDDLGDHDPTLTEDGKGEAASALAPSIFPSSMGLTFCVDGAVDQIQIIASWGQYERNKSEAYQTQVGNPKTVWKRYPIQSQSPPIPLKLGSIREWQVDRDFAVFVRGYIRKEDYDWLISIFLVNAQTEPEKNSEKDRAWLFQPKLVIQSANPEQPDIFCKRTHIRENQHRDVVYHADGKELNMLYRRQVEFAVGHGVGVHCIPAPLNPTRATQLETTFIPTQEVPKSTPPTADEIPELKGLVLKMNALANASMDELVDKLIALPNAYEHWIQEQYNRIDDPHEGLSPFHDTAKRALANCQTVLTRINEGLKILDSDPQSARAFIFMNRVMHLQRVRSVYARNKRQGKDIILDEISSPTWYPFQLAFILLNIASITDLKHPDRSDPTKAIADLLWFPTGGGKTEAYLGLAAYTIGLRRLQGTIAGRSGEAGVAVLMRYTLRLLTLQQFQRATALICACEVVRREDETSWGQEPFRIGLWVGMATTPNTTQESHERVNELRNGMPVGQGSPHQLTSCPWCGTSIDKGRHINVNTFKKGNSRTIIHCGDRLGHCPFSRKQSPQEGLPIIVVDEEIYRRLPTLLIATVDKFAQMPWKGETQMIFGQVNGYCDRHGYRSPCIEDSDSHPALKDFPKAITKSVNPLRPPDLIIQDELHLISGPLGTLVGLYETAIDRLASWDVDGILVRPKVIASTATIRQAGDQVHSLFLRKVNIFPPQGLDISDNFFSRQRDPSEANPGRRYLGICATGRRLKAATIRVYAALLSASQDLYNNIGDKVDPWMTLVGYFNSMRELGGTRRLVDDDIQQRLNKMERRGLAKRYLTNVEELTSRKSSTDIPDVLDNMETPFQTHKKEKDKPQRKPLDVLLATNMISVGVDVPRLAVMAVTGQPKTTAEYIQSTSRVGRQHPGIVFTIFNWARPRDLSHYERFEYYHATFYQHVENLSLTPFSSGAMDRGLAALLVSLVRLSKDEFNKNESAGRIERNDPDVQSAIEYIVDRAWHISGDPNIRDVVRRELDYRLDYWLDQAQDTVGGKLLGYKTQKDGSTIGLLEQPIHNGFQPFTCLNSLRNVEPTIGLILNPNVPDDDLTRLPQPMPTHND